MTAITYVNLHGVQIHIPTTPVKQKKTSRAKAADEKQRLGWRVVGYRPGLVDAHRDAHDAAKGPFDADAWMSRNRPTNVRTKLYSLPSAAAECARLAVAAGWTGVRVVEVIR